MKRREFVKNAAGLFVSVTALTSLSAWAETEVEYLERKDVENDCQSVDEDHKDNDAEVEQNYTKGEQGILAHSVGCRAPHKHLLFLPIQYLQNPDLIGPDSKTFLTSFAFDMGFWVKHSVGAHQHEVKLTKEDIQQIINNPDGIKKIAYQFVPFIGKRTGETEPGHVFHLKASSLNR